MLKVFMIEETLGFSFNYYNYLSYSYLIWYYI